MLRDIGEMKEVDSVIKKEEMTSLDLEITAGIEETFKQSANEVFYLENDLIRKLVEFHLNRRPLQKWELDQVQYVQSYTVLWI